MSVSPLFLRWQFLVRHEKSRGSELVNKVALQGSFGQVMSICGKCFRKKINQGHTRVIKVKENSYKSYIGSVPYIQRYTVTTCTTKKFCLKETFLASYEYYYFAAIMDLHI